MNNLRLYQTFYDMFVLTVPVLEKVLRPWLVYIFLVVSLRLAGKRELAQLNTFDLIVLLMLSNTVQDAIIGEDSSVTGGLLGATTLLALNWLVVRFVYAHPEVERCVLEPGGTISFVQRLPTPEETRYEAILRRLDALSIDVAALRP